jgi:phosphoribosylformylglycinamidine synthase subunit PurS
MKLRFHVVVSLKEGLLDPQGKAIEGALPAMGWGNVGGVRVGKYIELVIEAETEDQAVGQLEDMARRFLSNPVIEDFRIAGRELLLERPGKEPLAEAVSSDRSGEASR